MSQAAESAFPRGRRIEHRRSFGRAAFGDYNNVVKFPFPKQFALLKTEVAPFFL
jgi:hypothetical protein